jgi:hypothetical protein
MPRTTPTKPRRSEARYADVFKLRTGKEPTREAEAEVHLLGPGIVCDTEPRGRETPNGQSPTELILDSTAGFIPLWARNTTLRWRFRERSMASFANPVAAKREIRKLFGEALVKWGTAVPVRFKEDNDLWDFELVMNGGDNCNASGCVLASTFFPDSGRHKFMIYPKMFTQSRKEQVDTFVHEVGHIFGLRHFFARISESKWPSEIFGTQDKFTIMNYGELSELSVADRQDLARLYQAAWSGALTHVNGTPIRLVTPFTAATPAPLFAVGLQPAFPRAAEVAYV